MTERRQFPSDVFFAMFAGAAGRAAMFEMKARVFVDAIPELKGSLKLSLEPLVKEITAWAARETPTTPEECAMLQRCAKLRNKLFHAELSRATGQLVELGVELDREGVRRFTWDGPVTLENFSKSIDEGGVLVSKLATKEGGIMGWLMNANQTGALGAAALVFDDGAELLNRILYDWTAAQVAARARDRSDEPG